MHTIRKANRLQCKLDSYIIEMRSVIYVGVITRNTVKYVGILMITDVK